jgi:ligand-binding sensor domain-containing protein
MTTCQPKIRNKKMKKLKHIIMTINTLIQFGVLTIFASCIGQEKKSSNKDAEITANLLVGDTVSTVEGEIRGIVQDTKNNLWFASNGNGIYKYDGKSIINFTEKHGLSSNYVWMVKEGKNGNIWFRTHVRSNDVIAMCSFNGYEFKTIQADTNAISYDFKKGELLFDYYFDGQSLSKIRLPHTSPIEIGPPRFQYDIYASCLDKSGNVWFGTQGTGICKYDGKSYTWFDNKEFVGSIRDIYEDKNGRIWVGNNGDGLFRYDGKSFINFSKEKNLHNLDYEKYPNGKPGLMSRVWKTTQDNQGNLWMATIDNGAWMYNGKTVVNYTSKDGLSLEGIGIWTIYCDKQGKLWFGTEGDGVYAFAEKKFNKF